MIDEAPKETLTDLNQAIAQDPADIGAIARRGETYRQMRQYKKALIDFNRVLALNPGYVWAIAHRGATYYRLGRFEEGLVDLNRAVDLKPDYSWAMTFRGATYYQQKRYEAALVEIDRAVALDENIVSHWRGERGLILNSMGRYAETITCCRQALTENPDDYVALYSLAVARTLSEGVGRAQADIDVARSVLLSVTNMEIQGLVLYRLGGLAALEGQVDQALDYLRKAVPRHDEPIVLARHDPAWVKLVDNPRFQALITAPSVA